MARLGSFRPVFRKRGAFKGKGHMAHVAAARFADPDERRRVSKKASERRRAKHPITLPALSFLTDDD